jgi:organic radical activating enzyme
MINLFLIIKMNIEDLYVYVAGIRTTFNDVPGQIATSIFLSGCDLRCKGCQNKELWDLTAGKLMTVKQLIDELNDFTLSTWICFVGGEPLLQSHSILPIMSYFQNKSFALYSGYDYDFIESAFPEIVYNTQLKLLITGKYIEEIAIPEMFPISDNQEIRYRFKNDWEIIKQLPLVEAVKLFVSIKHIS